MGGVGGDVIGNLVVVCVCGHARACGRSVQMVGRPARARGASEGARCR